MSGGNWIGRIAGAPLTSWRAVVLVTIALLIGFYPGNFFKTYSFSGGLFDEAGYPVGGDFVNIWSAGRIALEGKAYDLFHVEQFHQDQERLFGRPLPPFNWSYPPHLVPWLLPFGLPDYVPSFILWSAATFAAFAAAILVGRPRRWAILPMVLLAPGSFVNLMAGQNGFLTGALLIGGLRLIERNPVWAGVLFGFLTIKPQLGLLVPVALLACGAWRAILSACATTVILVVASIVLFGTAPWHSYIAETMPYQRDILETGTGLFTEMMPTPFMAARLTGLGTAAGYVLNGITALISILIVAWAYRHAAVGRDLRVAIFATATFLTSPYAFNYDMTILSAGLIGLLAYQSAERLRHGELLAIVAAWVLPIALLSGTSMIGVYLPVGPFVLAAMLAFLALRARTYTGQLAMNSDPQSSMQSHAR